MTTTSMEELSPVQQESRQTGMDKIINRRIEVRTQYLGDSEAARMIDLVAFCYPQPYLAVIFPLTNPNALEENQLQAEYRLMVVYAQACRIISMLHNEFVVEYPTGFEDLQATVAKRREELKTQLKIPSNPNWRVTKVQSAPADPGMEQGTRC